MQENVKKLFDVYFGESFLLTRADMSELPVNPQNVQKESACPSNRADLTPVALWRRCDKNSDNNGATRLASVRCPVGLAFDIERQTCDWKTKVNNCDVIESKSMRKKQWRIHGQFVFALSPVQNRVGTYRHCFLVETWYLSPILTYRCTKSGLKQITCPSGLAFDIDKQTCDWKGKVNNCDKLESKSHFRVR